MIVSAAKNKTFDDATRIPFNKVGILLGTSKMLPGGHHNLYYANWIKATVELLQNRKIKYLVISGDNSLKSYNEPEDMRADLMKEGFDSSLIYLDYAGFRTYDSMIRLKEIFGQGQATVISQKFHNERAIYTGKRLGMSVIGFNADDVSYATGFKTQVRERLARVKVFLDFLFAKKPKFLGEKIIIPS